MGRRRGRCGRPSSKFDDHDNSDNISYLQLQRDKNSPVENQILDARHPFELNHFVDSKVVTPSQRAITCCIQQNNGWVSEDTLLQFLQTNWSFIGKLNTKLPNNMPDTRILHINLAVKKKGIPLFVHSSEDAHMWTVNKASPEGKHVLNCSSAFSSTDNISIEPRTFEACVMAVLKNKPEGISLDDLVEETREFEGKEGAFKSLEHHRRVKAILVQKKMKMEVFEEDNYWSVGSNITAQAKEITYTEESTLPQQLKNLDVTDLSIGQFFELLKEHKIY